MAEIPIALVGVDHPHVRDWHRTLARIPELVPVAHYDPHPEAAHDILEPPLDRLPLYGDLADLLGRHQVEAALVMLPLPDAERAMLKLAQLGVHIMAEKPVARTAPELEPVMQALRPETAFYAGYCWRFDPMMQQIRSLVEGGILGQLWSIEMRWITSRVGFREGVPAHRDPRSYLFRAEISRGGMLHWLGCHFLDLMMFLTNQSVASVTAMTTRQTTSEIEVEDTATCLLRFEGGLLGSLHTGYLLPEGGQTFLGLRGSLGWVHWDATDGWTPAEAQPPTEVRRLIVHTQHPDWVAAPTRVMSFPRPVDATYGGGTGELLLRDWARCIRQRAARPSYTIADAARVLKVLDAAYDSAASGTVIPVQ